MPKHSPWIFNIHHHSRGHHRHQGGIHYRDIGQGGRRDGGWCQGCHRRGGGDQHLGGKTAAGGLMQGQVSRVSGLH